MRLIPDWKIVLRSAWSIRFIVLSAIFTALEVALPFLEGYLPVSTGVFAALSGFSAAAAFVSRLVAQQGITKE